MSDAIFEHIQHANGVHEMIFYESSPAAVDASIVIIDGLLAARPAHDPQPLLLLSNNVLSGDEPIAYATNAYRKLAQKHGLARLSNTYLALVYKPGMLMSFWVALFSSFRVGIRMKTFPENRHVDAMAWLEAAATPEPLQTKS